MNPFKKTVADHPDVMAAENALNRATLQYLNVKDSNAELLAEAIAHQVMECLRFHSNLYAEKIAKERHLLQERDAALRFYDETKTRVVDELYRELKIM